MTVTDQRHCPACGGPRPVKWWRKDSYVEIAPKRYAIVLNDVCFCADCGLILETRRVNERTNAVTG